MLFRAATPLTCYAIFATLYGHAADFFTAAADRLIQATAMPRLITLRR